MRRLALVVGALALATGVAASAWAQPGGRGCGMCPMAGGITQMHHAGPGGMGPMGGMHGILGRAEELGLTKEQVEKIRALATGWAEQRVDRTAGLEKARIRLAAALRADEVDMKEVEKRLDAVLQAQKELQLGQIRHMTEVRNVLTDEQREKIGEGPMGCPMMGERPGRRTEGAEGMHRGRGMCGGMGMHR